MTASAADRGLKAETLDKIRAIAALYPRSASALLPALYLAQKELGHVGGDVYRQISPLLGLSPTQIEDAATYYVMFHKKPAGKYPLEVCTNLTCALKGARATVDALCSKLRVKPGEVSGDGLFSVREVECLGACENAPVVQVEALNHPKITAEKVDDLIADFKSSGGQKTREEEPR